MTTTSSTRRVKSAAVAESREIPPADAIAGTSTGSPGVQTFLERAREMSKTLRDAQARLTDVDWTRESESISLAQVELDEVTMKYCEGTASRAEVKTCYQQFVKAHRGGLF